MLCRWTIAAPVGDITIQFTSLNTQTGHDTVTIYECETLDCSWWSSCPVKLAELSGSQESLNVRYTTSLGFMQVIFATDSSIAMSGFEATWSVSQGAVSNATCIDCPVHAVSDDGSSLEMDCVCDVGYTGPDGEPCETCGE